MTPAEILAYIRLDAQRRARMERLFKYYRAKHAITERVLSDPSKPNNKLAHGFPKYIANSYAGYLFGEPVTYGAMEDEALAARVKDAFEYNDEASENARLGLDLAICGAAVELMYVDADGAARFGRVDPVGCVPVRDGTIEDNLTALIRYFNRADVVTGNVTGTVQVYEAEAVTEYTVPGGIGEAGTLTLTEGVVTPHYFGDVPAIVYLNNPDALGDFECEISLIDAYDLMQSESLNDQEYFSDAYLKLKGIGEMGDVGEMKRKRVLLLPEDGDAEWLIKTQSDTLVENIKDRLNHDIHRFSGCPDMSDENFAGNASGVAMRFKLLQFENIAGIKEREFKRGLQRRLELLCGLWNRLDGARYDWRGVKIEFHRSLPQNLLELSQVVGNLSDVLSDETKRSLLPIDIDEDEEKRRLEEERGDSMFTPQERRTGWVEEEKSEE